MFNRYMWDLYIQSGGDKVVEMFRRNLAEQLTDEYAEEIARMRKYYCINDNAGDVIRVQIEELIKLYKEYDDSLENEMKDYEESVEEDIPDSYIPILEEFYQSLALNNSTPQMVFDDFSGGMIYYSTDLSVLFPQHFVPYYFQFNFNVLQKIAEEFDIELPDIPVKKDYKGRVYYYGEISKSLLDFAKKNDLSYYELYAFLYDFAPHYIGGTDSYIVKDLPAPRSAFFIGADQRDKLLADNHSEITSWQCSPDTRVGDMIVMYMRTPISAIESIWRACSVGFIDPFFYYYRCVYISQPVKIPSFSLEDMRKDSFFKTLPIVRKNMQGVNGVELLPSVYNHLLDKTKAQVLRLEYEKTEDDDEYTREKDVENKLIKPLLAKLGYNEDQYEQQLYIEIGNRNKALIPDFVLLPDKRRGHVSGFAIIEAKRSISSDKMLKEVFVQARSYARVLSTKYCAVASKEKIWIAQRKDDYDAIIFEATWKELNKEDCLYALDKLIGN